MVPPPDVLKQPQLISRSRYNADAMKKVNIAAIAAPANNAPPTKIPPIKHIPTSNSSQGSVIATIKPSFGPTSS
jgi:hypothetical protein